MYLKNVLEAIWEMTKNDVLINFLVFLYTYEDFLPAGTWDSQALIKSDYFNDMQKNITYFILLNIHTKKYFIHSCPSSITPHGN